MHTACMISVQLGAVFFFVFQVEQCLKRLKKMNLEGAIQDLSELFSSEYVDQVHCDVVGWVFEVPWSPFGPSSTCCRSRTNDSLAVYI